MLFMPFSICMVCVKTKVFLRINYDGALNENGDCSQYLRRMGLSYTRMGRKKTAISFLTPSDVGSLRAIEDRYSIEMHELPSDIVDNI